MFLSFLSSTTSAEASGGAGIEVTCAENSHTLVSPFEADFKYIITITITNTGDTKDTINIGPGFEPGTNEWVIIGAGGQIQLDPGETGYFATIVGLPRGEPDGAQFSLPFTISSTNDPSKAKSVTLTTTLRDLGPFDSLPRGSALSGKVYDIETGEPIPNAEIGLMLWIPNWGEQSTTDTDGSYHVPCISYEYMREIRDNYSTRNPPSHYLEVHAAGYRSYYENGIMPPEGGTLQKDIYLERRTENASYELSWEKSLGFGVWKAPASENWDYIAVSTGEHDPPGPGETPTYGIYLYGSDGNLIWSHQTETQVWGIDISRDGKCVAAGSMAPESNVYLYDRVADSLWENTIEMKDIREVKFSHDGRYLAVGLTTIQLYDVATKQLLWENETGSNWVREITFSPDDSYVVAANGGDRIYVFDTTDGTLRWKRFHGGYCPFVLEISQDGSRIGVAGKSHEVYMYDHNGNLLWTYPTEQVITDGRMSADGSRMVVGTVWGLIHCLDGNGNLLWRKVRNVGHNSVYMTKNGKYVALGGWGVGSSGIMLLDNEGTVLWQDNHGRVDYVAVSEDGSKIIAGYSDPDIIRLYEGGIGYEVPPGEERAPPAEGVNIVLIAIGAIVAALFVVMILRRR